MKYIIILLAFLGNCYFSLGQSLRLNWMDQIGGLGWDVLSSMALTPDGKLLIAGSFYESITIKNKTYQSKGSRDCFLVIYNKDGSIYKSVSFGGKGYEYIKQVTVTDDGFILAIVKFEQETAIGEKTTKGKSLNNDLVVCFDDGLNLISQNMISCDNDFEITGIEKSDKDTYAFTGWYSGNITMEDKRLTSENNVNFFQGKINSKGKLSWIKQYESSGGSRSFKLKSDDSGSSYILGITKKGNFEGVSRTKEVNANMQHLFLTTTKEDGKVSAINYPVYGLDFEPVDLLKDDNLVWMLVNFRSPVYIDATEVESNGMSDILLLRFDLTTQKTTFYQLGGYGNDTALGLVKSGQQIVVSGSFSDALNVSGQTVKASPLGPDVFIATFAGDGSPQSITSLKGDKIEFPTNMIPGESGIYLGGEYTGTMSSTTATLGSHGNEDIFIAYIENCNASDPVKITATAVDPKNASKGWELNAGNGYKLYSWDNGASLAQYYTVTKPGTYTVKVNSYNGCEYTASIEILGTKSAQLPPDLLTEHGFSIYPTITNGLVNWQPSTAWLNKEANVSVTDISGKTVMNTKIESLEDCSYSIDLSGRVTGTYIVNVQGEGFYESTKIVVKK